MTSPKSDGILHAQIKSALKHLLQSDAYLVPYQDIICRRLTKIADAEQKLTPGKQQLADFACGHAYFGLHFEENQWIFREWAPNATAVYLIGDMSGWQEKEALALKPLTDGVWEIRLAAGILQHGDLYRLRIHWPGGAGDRIPA